MTLCFPIVKIKHIRLFEEITCYLFMNYMTTEHLVQTFVRLILTKFHLLHCP